MNFEYTPTEYEIAFKNLFQKRLTDHLGQPVNVEHDVQLMGDSGHEHQIDAMATFMVGGFEFKMIVECKRYSENVSVDRILTLKSRMDDTNVHKGLIVTTHGFHSKRDSHIREVKRDCPCVVRTRPDQTGNSGTIRKCR